MSENKKKVVIICGPTATGKSDYAIKLAKKINGEVISADSRQVYKGMNIGTGKITKKEMHGIPHHMLDIISPRSTYSVAQYQKHARKVIDDILKRGKVPIICGGTGFYIDSIIYNNNFPEVPPDKKLRAELEKLSVENLFKKLQKLDPERAENIDSKNPVRLIRAIEITTALGKVPVIHSSMRVAHYDVEWIGLDFSDTILKSRIHTRLLKRIKIGVFAEIKKLHTNGISWKRMEELGLEYRYGSRYVRELISKEECIDKLNTEIWHYAKRQRTWFKKNNRIKWRYTT